MKQLSRKKIQDMIDLNGANISSRRSSGGSGGGGGGGVSSAWVDEHYVSKDFFARLFTINGTDENDDEVVVEPNDLETTITDIQLMFGTWTEHYLSALGQGSGGGGGGGVLLTEPLASINEAGMGTPSGANKVIAWNGNTWTYMPYTTGSGTVTSVTMTVPTGFKVSNGDTQTINNSGTFALTFGGTITKNRVLASPAAANGTPAWRALVADDIPTLTAAKISDITLTNGTLTIGSNTITPLTDATLKNDYEWWGGKLDATTKKREGEMSNVGNIKIDNDAKISWKKAGASNYLSMLTLDTYNKFIVGESMASSGYTTYLRGRSITFQTGTGNSGNHTASMSNAGLFTVEKLKIGSIVISEDTQNGGLHVESAGIYADTYVSSLGTGSGGGGGTPLNSLLMSLNDASGVQNPTSVSNKVLVNNRGTWSWETYGGGGSGTIGGASDKADYFTGYVANSAAKLSPGKKINGTTFTGESDITTDKWGTARTITIKDNDATNQQANTNIDGSADFILKLPASIKATLTGNADTATKLKTARTLWGNSFDGSQSIGYVDNNNTAHYANLNFVGSITMNSSITGCTSIDSLAYFFTTGKQLRVSSSSQSAAYSYSSSGSTKTARLHVDGNISATGEAYLQGIDFAGYSNSDTTKNHGGYLDFNYGAQTSYDYTTRVIESSNGVLSIIKRSGATGLVVGGNSSATQADYIKIGGATITWDNTNQALHIDKGVYSDTYVSSLGIGSGGGGGGMTEDQMWEALGTNGQAKQVALTHLTLALQNYAKTSDVTKKLTIKQDGQEDIEYNGTAAREITISAGGFEMKSVTNATLKGLSGTFGFYGYNLPDNDTRNYDWVGIQVGTTNDKWQLMADLGHLMVRQNDNGGSSSTGWVPASSVESSGWYTVLDSGNYKSVIGNTYSTKDTKNTAGARQKPSTKLYLVGTESFNQEYAVTNINGSVYIGTDNCLYSNGGRVVGPIPAGDYDFNFGDGVTTGGIYQVHSGQATQQNAPFDFGLLANFVSPNGHLQIAAAGSNQIYIRSYWWTNGGSQYWHGYPQWQTLIHSGNISSYLSGYDTKNTAGARQKQSTKLYLVGTESFNQEYAVTNTNGSVYINSGNNLCAPKFETVSSNSRGFYHRFATNSSGNGGLAVENDSQGLNQFFVWINYNKEVTLGSASFNANTYIYGNHVGIGTSSPGDYKLYVDGTGYFNSILRINAGIEAPNGDGLLVYAPASGWTGISSSQWGVGCVSKQGVIRSSNSNLLHYKGSASYAILDASNARNYCMSLQGIGYDGAVNLPSGYNLNNILAAGTYCCQSGSVAQSQTNVPYASGNYRLWHIVNTGDDNSSSNQYSAQIVLAPNEGRMFIRSHAQNSFGAWKEFATTGNSVTLDSAQNISGAKTFTSKMSVNADFSCSSLVSCTNEIASAYLTVGSSKLNTSYNLYVNGTTYFNGDVDITKGKKIYFQHNASGVPEISIGTKSNDANLYLQGVNLYFNSSIINSSDMRLKDVDELVDGDIESIARAPIFYYRWKKTPEFGPHLGSSAQYWQNVFSCAVVKDEEGYLGLDYAATALAAAVITARTVQNHEDRILELERENETLRKEIETLKAA